MAANFTLPPFLPFFWFSHPPSSAIEDHCSPILLLPILSIVLLFTLSLALLSVVIYSHDRRLKTTPRRTPLSKSVHEDEVTHESDLARIHSLLLEILPSNSPNWAILYGSDPASDESGVGAGRVDTGGGDYGKKKRKKRKKGKKKKKAEEGMEEREKGNLGKDLVCLYPFTSSSSAMQRKIKHQYDQLIKSHGSDGLTLTQMEQFVNCLVDARNDLKHKSEIIQRKFTITKALLLKADRSSFDRLCQQIHKLELDHKRLEEDAFVYNWLQQQLKLSPAYWKMLEIGVCMELKAKSVALRESADEEFGNTSFEEFLAQEKKDSFWLKNGKPRSCPDQ